MPKKRSKTKPENKSEVTPGSRHPLGATFDGKGTNFALFSEHATGATLCLFGGKDGNDEVARVPLVERTEHVWHGYIPGVGPGQRYGYRVAGPYDPPAGHRFNPAKLLLDPYTRAIDRAPEWHDSMLGSRASIATAPFRADSRNSAHAMPKCVVVDPSYDWADERRPNIADEDLVIYEAHVKGMTALHPEVAARIGGTYAALASPAVIRHLQSLGVNAIELMPVHQTAPEQRLYKVGLTNYWGYNTIGYFAPDIRFGSHRALGAQVTEFKDMVKSFHAAGIEVILDVVFNHTGEGGEGGPTICFRGLDNAAYYRLSTDGKGRYEDFTGTGNSLNLMHPRVLQLVMDSIRYWLVEMHVDGFRFDLATTLARGPRGIRLAEYSRTIRKARRGNRRTAGTAQRVPRTWPPTTGARHRRGRPSADQRRPAPATGRRSRRSFLRAGKHCALSFARFRVGAQKNQP